MRKILPGSFFDRDTEKVARELLGKFLVRKIGGREISAMITETESYDGPHDLANHASKGRTKRTEVLFGEAGHFYVYLCYGIHWLLNIVTGEEGYPAGVLIRAVEGANGPGVVTKRFGIDKRLHGVKAARASGLWVEDRGIRIGKIKKGPRVGVHYAGPIWSEKNLRFMIESEHGRKR